jgi:hypothetical protein
MPLGRPINGSRMTMMRCSTGDRGEIGFVGIPQALSTLVACLPYPSDLPTRLPAVPSCRLRRTAPG